jgi:diguanylate cyclase (GGDEF)-like protein
MTTGPTPRDIALSRITSSIRSALELPVILQTAVDEVGRAVGALHCAARVDGEPGINVHELYYFRGGPSRAEKAELAEDLNVYYGRLSSGNKAAEQRKDNLSTLAVPLIYQLHFVGILLVRSDDPARSWREGELLLMRTVADLIAFAVGHARLFARFQSLALMDDLTGLYNRRSFNIQLDRDIRLATRLGQPLALIMFDIDHFKRVNDMHGHSTGDQVLRIVARLVEAELRGVDTVARYGGEEFMVILPQANEDGASVIAERIRRSVEQAKMPEVGCVTVSSGIAIYPDYTEDRDTLLSFADRALYEAKRAGRNRVYLGNYRG